MQYNVEFSGNTFYVKDSDALQISIIANFLLPCVSLSIDSATDSKGPSASQGSRSLRRRHRI